MGGFNDKAGNSGGSTGKTAIRTLRSAIRTWIASKPTSPDRRSTTGSAISRTSYARSCAGTKFHTTRTTCGIESPVPTGAEPLRISKRHRAMDSLAGFLREAFSPARCGGYEWLKRALRASIRGRSLVSRASFQGGPLKASALPGRSVLSPLSYVAVLPLGLTRL